MVEINVYCDESNHLLNDNSNIMTIGLVYLPKHKVREVNIRLREIKEKNKINLMTELKWSKITNLHLQAYLDLVDYFFDDDDLCSRVLIIPNKQGLDHERFNQNHDDWYYKMHFRLIENVIQTGFIYNIYLDYKDTNMNTKSLKLNRYLTKKFSKNIVSIEKIQPIRSNEVELMQIVDILIGAVAYKNKGLYGNNAKSKVIDRIIERSKKELVYNSLLREHKLNLFVWDIAGDSREL